MGELLPGTNCANIKFEKLCARHAKEAAYVNTIANAAGVESVEAKLVVSTANRKASAECAEALHFAHMVNTAIGVTGARTKKKNDTASVSALYI